MVKNNNKTNEQLLKEIDLLKAKITELEKSETKRKSIEQANKKAEEALRLTQFTVDNSTDAVYWMGPDAKLIYVNYAAVKALGYTREELLTMTVHDIGPEFPAEFWPAHWAELKEKKSFIIHTIHQRKDKSTFPVEITVNFIHFGGREINCAIAKDITERYQAEQALKESEYLLRESQQVANLGSYVLDLSSGIWKSSLILDDVFGIDKKYNKDISGWIQIVHPEDRTMMQDYFAANVLTNHEPFNKEYRIKRINDQQERWVQGLGELEFDDDGNPIKMIGTIQDITERKQAEEECEKLLHDKEERVKELQCMYGVSESIRTRDTLEEIFQDVVELIPTGWHYPEITRGKIIFKGKEYVSEPFEVSKCKQSSDIIVNGELLGSIEVYYLKECPELDEGPFLNEERNLINGIAKNISEAIEHKQAESQRETALEALHQYEHIVSSSTDMMALLDKNFTYLASNTTFFEAFGITSEELIGSTVEDVFGKEPFESIIKPNAARCLSGEVINYQEWFNFPTKGKCYMDVSYFPYKDKQNKTKGFVVNARDITKHKKTEDTLKESEQHYRDLFNSINDLVCIHDLEGNVLSMNPAAEKNLGYKIGEVLNKNLYELLAPEIRSQFNDYLTKIKKEGKVKGLMLIQTRTGEKRIWEYNNSLVKTEGKEQFISGVARDVTEVKKAEKTIQESEERYRSLFEDSLTGVYISSFEGELLDCNEAFVKMFGYASKEELKKVPTNQYYENRNDRNIFLEKIKEKGSLINYVEKLKRKDGSFIWTLQNVRQLNNRIQGTVVDISADIESRNALIEAKEKAEEANKLKSNFLANISHELRTPMVGIIGFTEVLEEEVENPELKEYASFIHEAGNRLMETLNLILNLTKIEAEKLNIELSKIDVVQNIKKTISIFDKMAAKKNIYLRFERTVDKLETETDERMFDQIISNLANNAVKFTEKGGVTVSVNKVKNNSYLEIKVKDTGIGIPKDKQEIIWHDFRQVSEGTSRAYEGTGLGLTVTKNFVHKLGGDIKLESELGKGSTFTVLLPILEQSISIKTNKPTSNKTTDTQNTKDAKDAQEELKTLLYVEDDKISCEVIPLFLKGRYKIECAKNGEEGIEKAKQKIYDGILMDINLQSKMDGIQVAEKIKEMEEYKGVPIIAVTAYAMVGDREKYLGAGFTEYISKPFSKNDIIELLNKTIKEKN